MSKVNCPDRRHQLNPRPHFIHRALKSTIASSRLITASPTNRRLEQVNAAGRPYAASEGRYWGKADIGQTLGLDASVENDDATFESSQ
jgi:hypothetical protein